MDKLLDSDGLKRYDRKIKEYIKGNSGTDEGLEKRVENVEESVKSVQNKVTEFESGESPVKNAEQDYQGNVIHTTYAKKTVVDGMQSTVSGLSGTLQSIEEGREAVPRAIADEDGNEIVETYATNARVQNIEDTYATKEELADLSGIVGMNESDIAAIGRGDIIVGKAVADESGNNIAKTYAKQDQVNSLAYALQDIEEGYTVVPLAEADANGNVIHETYATKEEVAILHNVAAINGTLYKAETEAEYNTRETADGLPVLDGSKAILKKVVGNTVRCENFLPFPYLHENKAANGITYTVNDDRSVTAQGTSTAALEFRFFKGTLPVGQYTLTSGAVEIGENTDSYAKLILRVGKNDVWYAEGATVRITVENETDIFTIYYYCKAGATYNVNIRPMLNEGTTALPYQHYFKGLKSASFAGIESINADGTQKDTLAFPKTEVPMGVTLDFEREKIIEGSKEIVFDGTENWVLASGGYFYAYVDKPESSQILGVCNLYPYINDLYTKRSCFVRYGSCNISVPIAAEFNSSVDEWKAHLAELYAAGTPLTVRYLVATPTEKDFTDEQITAGNEYRVWNGGTEIVRENDNADYGANNTLTQNYIAVNEE